MSDAPIAVLLSGGMDSTTLLWWLRDRRPRAHLHAISIDYGQRHRVELEHAARLAARAGADSHRILPLDLSSLGGNPLTDPAVEVPAAADGRQAVTVVPFRNLLFVTVAAAYAETRGIGDIYLAPVRDDFEAYRDCRREFYDALEGALRLGAPVDRPVQLHTPFIDKWKSEIIALGLQLDVPYELTHTCYTGRRPSCGRCDACTERLAAFRANGVRDPLEYEPDGGDGAGAADGSPSPSAGGAV